MQKRVEMGHHSMSNMGFNCFRPSRRSELFPPGWARSCFGLVWKFSPPRSGEKAYFFDESDPMFEAGPIEAGKNLVALPVHYSLSRWM